MGFGWGVLLALNSGLGSLDLGSLNLAQGGASVDTLVLQSFVDGFLRKNALKSGGPHQFTKP